MENKIYSKKFKTIRLEWFHFLETVQFSLTRTKQLNKNPHLNINIYTTTISHSPTCLFCLQRIFVRIKIMASGATCLDIVPTKAMLRLQQQQKALLAAEPTAHQFKAVVFESHKSKSKANAAHNPKLSKSAINDSAEFDLKRAKHEVLNFGISGFETNDKVAAKIALAVKLGARPPKNPYTNYKDLLAEKQRVREASAQQSAMLQLGKNAQGVASVTYKKLHNARRKKKLDGQITRHYGVVNPKIHKKKK